MVNNNNNNNNNNNIDNDDVEDHHHDKYSRAYLILSSLRQSYHVFLLKIR